MLCRNIAWIALFMAAWSSVNLRYHTRRILVIKVETQTDQTTPLLRNEGRLQVGGRVQRSDRTTNALTTTTTTSSRSTAPPRISVVAQGLGPVGAANDHDSTRTSTQARRVNQTQSTTSSTDRMSKNKKKDDTSRMLNSCAWGPMSGAQCFEMLRKRLTLPLSRLLFFGDSTIHNLVRQGALLDTLLVDDAIENCPNSSCEVRTSEQCNRTYGLPSATSNEFWLKPDLTIGEGPISHGYGNPGCSDCSGCDSRFLDCSAKEPEKRCLVPHGGYVYTEFARDVVWQTHTYNTTQENTADLLRDGFAMYPNTVCVMAAGLHDMEITIENDLSQFIGNVNWYLSLYLDRVCEHVVWLGNASPSSDNYTQTIARTKEWNGAVQQELHENFRDSTTYIDLWSASQKWEHADNLHMDIHWNIQLTNLFVQLWIQTPTVLA
jgi:hypothetical protein